MLKNKSCVLKNYAVFQIDSGLLKKNNWKGITSLDKTIEFVLQSFLDQNKNSFPDS